MTCYISVINPVTTDYMENMDNNHDNQSAKTQGSYDVLLQINTLHFQQKD